MQMLCALYVSMCCFTFVTEKSRHSKTHISSSV